MNYLDWLNQIGCDFAKTAVSEREAIQYTLPLDDPDCKKMREINRIIIHHSATDTGSASHFRLLHRFINGWNDIGYHYVIGNGSFTTDGATEKGRKLPFSGAHARGANEDSIGVCLVGNFNRITPSLSQMSSLGHLLATLLEKYSLERQCITFHRLVPGSSTECPGKLLHLNDVLYFLDSK